MVVGLVVGVVVVLVVGFVVCFVVVLVVDFVVGLLVGLVEAGVVLTFGKGFFLVLATGVVVVFELAGDVVLGVDFAGLDCAVLGLMVTGVLPDVLVVVGLVVGVVVGLVVGVVVGLVVGVVEGVVEVVVESVVGGEGVTAATFAWTGDFEVLLVAKLELET